MRRQQDVIKPTGLHPLDSNDQTEAKPIQLIQLESPQADEIDLIDLWLVLVRHKKNMAIVFAAVILAGLLYAFSQQPVYKYSETIQLGSIFEGNGQNSTPRLIESPESLLVKIKENYIPWVFYQYRQKNGDNALKIEIEAKSPKNSGLIILESKGAKKNASVHQALIQQVVQKVESTHAPIINSIKSGVDVELNIAQLKLDALTRPDALAQKQNALKLQLQARQFELDNFNDANVMKTRKYTVKLEQKDLQNQLKSLADKTAKLDSEYKRLSEVDQLLETRIKKLSALINDLLKHRQQALSGIKDSANAMTMLLLDTQIQNNQTKLSNLEERLYIQQQNTRDELSNRISANKRDRALTESKLSNVENKLVKFNWDNVQSKQTALSLIDKLQIELARAKLNHEQAIERQQQLVVSLKIKQASLQETRPVFGQALQSLKPVGKSKRVILAVFIVLGLFLAIFAAFIIEFSHKVRDRKNSQNQTQETSD